MTFPGGLRSAVKTAALRPLFYFSRAAGEGGKPIAIRGVEAQPKKFLASQYFFLISS